LTQAISEETDHQKTRPDDVTRSKRLCYIPFLSFLILFFLSFFWALPTSIFCSSHQKCIPGQYSEQWPRGFFLAAWGRSKPQQVHTELSVRPNDEKLECEQSTRSYDAVHSHRWRTKTCAEMPLLWRRLCRCRRRDQSWNSLRRPSATVFASDCEPKAGERLPAVLSRWHGGFAEY